MPRFVPVLLLALVTPAVAAVGTWQPRQLPEIEEALRSAGIAVDPRELADPQHYPLNAVVELGDDCTAALVSPLGLLLGNRDCVLDVLRSQSIDGRDLLRDGIVAHTLGEELPGAPSVRVTLSIQDVTAQLRAGPRAVRQDDERAASTDVRAQRLLAACQSRAGYRCRIDAVQGGSEYWLIRQLEIRDVRMAYVPARAIGEFGGPDDHRIWPRQRANFVLLRAYVGPDGMPADHSELNVPLRPASHLKVQPAGLAAGDFALAAGFSGRTDNGNRELRVSFGNVRGVTLSGAELPAFTDVADLRARHTGIPPWDVGARMIAAINAIGVDGHTGSDSIPVNFLADFAVAGGGAGSPVLNARAELVGVVFDGNFGTHAAEAPSDPAAVRSVAVDIRFVLWMLQAVDVADRLLQELVVESGAVDAD